MLSRSDGSRRTFLRTLGAVAAALGFAASTLAEQPRDAWITARVEESAEAADNELRARVESVLARDAALEASGIRVKSVRDGVVVLSGEADSATAHRRALEAARGVDGVRRVDSEIRTSSERAGRGSWREAGVVR